MKKVAVYSGMVRPGGGPPGYVYNFYSASRRVTTNNQFVILGRIISERINSTKSETSFLGKVSDFIKTEFPDFYCVSPMARTLVKRFGECDIAVLHSLLHPRLVEIIRRKVDYFVYMPHSPSIIADEYMMDVSTKRLIPRYRVYRFLSWSERVCMSLADRLVFPSPGAMSAYAAAYPDIISQDKHVFIPSGVDLEIDDDDLKVAGASSEDGVIKVGYVGRFNAHKGFDIFCRLAEDLSSDKVRFIAAGDGPCSSPAVHKVGWVKDIKKFLLSEVDLVVVPNRVAYYDLLPLEAAAAARPLVFTPVGGSVDQARVLVDSIVARSMNYVDIADAVREAIERKLKDAGWGNKNRKVYCDHFTAEAMVKGWDNFISML